MIKEATTEDVAGMIELGLVWLKEIGIKPEYTLILEQAKLLLANHTFVSIEAGKVVGVLCLQERRYLFSGQNILEEGMFYVHPNYRERDIGKQLMVTGIELAKKRGIRKIISIPNLLGSDNPSIANHLLESLDFKVYGTAYIKEF